MKSVLLMVFGLSFVVLILAVSQDLSRAHRPVTPIAPARIDKGILKVAASLFLGPKAYAYSILYCGLVCTDPEGCECQCNGNAYQMSQGYACE